jgi:hypothetical protein
MTKPDEKENSLLEECIQDDISMDRYAQRLKTDEKERGNFIRAMRALGMTDEEISQRLA